MRQGRVLLADSHLPMLQGVRSLLESLFASVVMVADEGSLLETIERLDPDLVVVDLSMPVKEGTNVVRQLMGRFPAITFDRPQCSRRAHRRRTDSQRGRCGIRAQADRGHRLDPGSRGRPRGWFVRLAGSVGVGMDAIVLAVSLAPRMRTDDQKASGSVCLEQPPHRPREGSVARWNRASLGTCKEDR